MKQIYLLCALAFGTLGSKALAQDLTNGTFSGGIESNSQWYQNDKDLGFYPDQEQFRSNNYIRLDYTAGKFSAGLQYESYLPKQLLGYSDSFNDNKIANYYVRYQGEQLDITAGYFYDQFGSGLIYRSWEDRQIGINNALRGVRIAYSPNDYTTIKGMIGKQRRGFDVTEGTVQGLDAETDLTKLISKSSDLKYNVKIGASYVGVFEPYTGSIENFTTTTNSYSGRINLNTDLGIYSGLEYVYKSPEAYMSDGTPSTKEYDGSAFLFNLGYTKKGFGINATFRRLENMGLYSQRSLSESASNTFNEGNVNYLPALTRQQDYLLTNIYVYQAQPRLNFLTKQAGEIGGQLDIFYNIKKGSFLGGKYGTKLALNGSYWNGLNATFDGDSYKANFFDFGKKYFHDITAEVTKKWSPQWSSIFTYVHQYYDKGVVEGGNYSHLIANIVVGDVLYQINPKNSVRLELQHLQSKRERKNWAAAVLEYDLNQKWNFYVTDNYNYGNDDKDQRYHYYSVGGSYAKGSLRVATNYGRQRGGLICVGGVCRYVPENTGLTLSLQKSF